MRSFLSLSGSIVALALAAFLPTLPVSAQTITEFTAGIESDEVIPGTRLTTPTGGPWNNITFNWFADDATTPTAFGTLFITSQEYLGTPSNLGTAPGLIAQSVSVEDGAYQFASSVTLQANTQYWFYSNTSGEVSGSATVQAPGTTLYLGFNDGFEPSPDQTVNHRLSGTVVLADAPEPGSFALLGAGLGVVGLVARRKR